MDHSPPAELAEIVKEYHHLVAEHRLAGVEGSVRRHLRDRLGELEERFERLLAHHVPDEGARDEWRASLHHREAGPGPATAPAELLFRGRAETGSAVEVRGDPAGEADVVVDGTVVERLTGEPAGDSLVVGGLTFEETFAVPPDALAVLRDWVVDPSGPPPWEVAAELTSDGLVDRHFGLTPRGRRALRRLPG